MEKKTTSDIEIRINAPASGLGRAPRAALAIALMGSMGLASCGFKTNPTDGYQGVSTVQPYAAQPLETAVIRQGRAFSIEVLDENKASIGDKQIVFKAGEPAKYFVRSSLTLSRSPVSHDFRVDGLPAGVKAVAEPSEEGMVRLEGAPKNAAQACGGSAQGAPGKDQAQEISFSWGLKDDASEAQKSLAMRLGPNDQQIKRAFTVLRSASAAPVRLSVKPEISASVQEGRSVDFSVVADGVDADAAHPPILGVEAAGGNVKFVTEPTAPAFDNGKWQWNMKLDATVANWANAEERDREVRFAVTLLNTCDNAQKARLEAKARITRQAAPAPAAAAAAAAAPPGPNQQGNAAAAKAKTKTN